MQPKYFVSTQDIIKNSIDDIRKATYATIIDRYHDRAFHMDETDEDFIREIEEASVKMLQAITTWSEKNCCCCSADMSIAQRQIDTDYAKALNGIKSYPSCKE